MVEREGIYVGNREVIERYVGNRLVWGKWIRIGTIYGINAPKQNVINKNVVTIESQYENVFISHPRFNREKTKQVKILDVEHNRTFYAQFTFLANSYRGYSSAYTIGQGYYVVIEFRTQEEARQFVNNGHQTYTFYIR